MQDLGFDNLGFTNIALIYLMFSLNSFFVEPIMNKIGIKRTLCFSALTYALWEASFMLPAYRHEH